MSKITFDTKAHGKWILAGEHTVLRGGPALVFPILDRHIYLNYNEELPFSSVGDLDDFFEFALGVVKQEVFPGKITLNNEIPIRSGLGASAALSVVIARLFMRLEWIVKDEVFATAMTLEGFFSR